MLKFLGGLNFAHLRGLKAAKAEDTAARAAENPEDDCEDDEEDAQAEQTAAEDGADADADDGDGKGDKKGKAKKAKKKPAAEEDHSDGDDDENEEDEDEENGKKATSSDLRKAFARGRKFERARGAAIFGAPAAAGNVELAAKLAFDGEYANLSSAAAKGILEKAGGKGKGLSGRMDGKSPNLGPSSPREPDKAKAIESSWADAAKEFMPAK